MTHSDPTRIGAVNYLNTKALVLGLERGLLADRVELSFDVPAALAHGMAIGTLNVALMPVIALAELPELELVPGLSISTHGASRSVLLVSKVPIDSVRTIALDPESRTSNALVQVLCRGFWKVSIETTLGEESLAKSLELADACVRIGDKALFESPPEGCHVYDLGSAWTEWTGLPFVFAAWFARPGAVDRELYRALHASRRAGAREIDAIAEAYRWNGHHDPDLAARYLREHIQHRLGGAEVRAMERFYREAREARLIDAVPELRFAFGNDSLCHEVAQG